MRGYVHMWAMFGREGGRVEKLEGKRAGGWEDEQAGALEEGRTGRREDRRVGTTNSKVRPISAQQIKLSLHHFRHGLTMPEIPLTSTFSKWKRHYD